MPTAQPPAWGYMHLSQVNLSKPGTAGSNSSSSFLDASQSLARVHHQAAEWPGILEWLQHLPAVASGEQHCQSILRSISSKDGRNPGLSAAC